MISAAPASAILTDMPETSGRNNPCAAIKFRCRMELAVRDAVVAGTLRAIGAGAFTSAGVMTCDKSPAEILQRPFLGVRSAESRTGHRHRVRSRRGGRHFHGRD